MQLVLKAMNVLQCAILTSGVGPFLGGPEYGGPYRECPCVPSVIGLHDGTRGEPTSDRLSWHGAR